MTTKQTVMSRIMTVLMNEYRWPDCRRCPGGLSLTVIVERTSGDLLEVSKALDDMVRLKAVMRLRVDGTLKSLFYCRPSYWKDAPK